MINCPRCGRENAADARFCSNCGNSLVTRVAVQERRVVTALFADLTRSTGMGESLDPEVVRGIVGRFFELCSREVAARGGTVEKFSGDAVMAVFGIPTAHEDDPERAVRAAMAIRQGLSDGIAVRIGIESGEVVVGDPFGGATMATGDAMNVAARLEQQAQPGEVVVGANVYDAVRDLVEAEPLGDLTLRGHEAAVAGWRVSAVSADVGRPRGVPGLEAPLTGRDEELAALLNAADRAQRERKAVLFTIFGVPGVGKSRLTREATARLSADGWQVVRGRCLPYGDGITYWPMAEIVRALAGIDAEMAPDDALDRLRQLSPEADVADPLALAVGIRKSGEDGAAEAGAKDIAYAFRRLVESVAAATPLVLIFEDIHWAEPPLLDLIEYVATWTRDAPALIVCPSRPELLDTRPAWGSGRMEASRISLEPLTEEESRSLLGALLTVEDLPAALRQRVLDRAEGNPLFVEEVVRMLIEAGVVVRRDGHWYATQAAADVKVPDSVEALIRARLDTLPAPERVLLQAGSVVGRVFQRSAVASIAPPDQVPPPLETHLEDAILRDIITQERAPDEPTFRFRHILIRDVAYNTLPKARRAELHRAVAEWLREWAGARMDEFVEIEAYHLEQAVKLKREVGEPVEEAEVETATTALLAGANKAQGREDSRAQRTFAERGLALEPGGEVGLRLRLHDAEALTRLGDYRRAHKLAAQLVADAAAAGRPDIQGRALYLKGISSWITSEVADVQQSLEELRRAKDLLAEVGDWTFVTLAVENLGYEGWWYGNLAAAAARWQEMADIAREHGLIDREAMAVIHLAGVAYMRGDAEERRRLLHEARDLAEKGGNRLTKARVLRHLGRYTGTNESTDEGLRMLREAASVLEELGDAEELSSAIQFQGDVYAREANFEHAIELYQQALVAIGEHVGYRPEVQRRMAAALLAAGDIAGAEKVALEAVEGTADDDWATVSSTRMVLGQVRAAQGRLEEAAELLRSAVQVVDGTDHPKHEAYGALAEFMYTTGRTEEGGEWAARFREALRGYPPGSPYREYSERRMQVAEAKGSQGDGGTLLLGIGD